MKKIIALAVASAFVAPVMAAEVTVSGNVNYHYSTTDASGESDKIAHDDNSVVIGATSTTDAGYTVSAKFAIVDDNNAGFEGQGTALTIAGPFGKIGLGDNSGALDATGDWTDVAPFFGGYAGDGTDQAIAYTLPSLVPGLTLQYSFSPKGANYINNEADLDLAGSTEGEEAMAYSATYSMSNGVSVYYGYEEFDYADGAGNTTEHYSYGVRYTTGPLMVAFESGEADNVKAISSTSVAAGDDVEYRGIAATYKMGKTTFAFENQIIDEKNAAGEDASDETVLSVKQDLGGGLSVYAATSNNSANSSKKEEQSSVGVSFSF